MIPVETPQHLAALGAAASFAFALVLSVAGVLAAIGTEQGEVRPLLASKAWLAAREKAAVTFMRARRMWVIGLLFPQRGKHLAGDEWHPLDEEDNDGDQNSGTAVHEVEDLPARDHQAPVPPVLRSPVAEVRGPLDTLPHPAPDDDHGPLRDGDRPVQALPVLQQARAEADDLTTDDDYDTATLRIFSEAAAEHLVPTGEPAWATPPRDEHRECICDAYGMCPEGCANCRACSGDGEPETSGPGGLPGALRVASAAASTPGPEADPPGPDRAGVEVAPVTTAPCAAVDIAAKGDSTGPGIIICDECNYPLRPCPVCWDAIGHDGYDDHQCIPDPPGPDPVDVDTPADPGPGEQDARREGMGAQGEPATGAVSSPRANTVPPRTDPPGALATAIAGCLEAPEVLLPVWEARLAGHLRRAMDSMRLAVTT